MKRGSRLPSTINPIITSSKFHIQNLKSPSHMTSVSTPQSTPQIIEQKLGGLRRKLTGWLTVHGLGRWLLIVCGLIAADIIIDRVFEMDFAQRIIMLVVMAGGCDLLLLYQSHQTVADSHVR